MSQRPIARIGDGFSGQCCCHVDPTCIGMSGKIVSGSHNSMCDGIPIARVGDTVVGDCGHTGTIVSGSAITFIDGRPVARVGDSVSGCLIGSIISGSSRNSTV